MVEEREAEGNTDTRGSPDTEIHRDTERYQGYGEIQRHKGKEEIL